MLAWALVLASTHPLYIYLPLSRIILSRTATHTTNDKITSPTPFVAPQFPKDRNSRVVLPYFPTGNFDALRFTHIQAGGVNKRHMD
jgi:hypothetical protein